MDAADTQALTTDTVFDWYESLRGVLPVPLAARGSVQSIQGLLSLVDDYDAFVFDAFGVLNVGEGAIPGAASCLQALEAAGKSITVLSNGASITRSEWLTKMHGMGFHLRPEQVITSRDSMLSALADEPSARWEEPSARRYKPSASRNGVILPEGSRLDDLPGTVVLPGMDGFLQADRILFMSADGWTDQAHKALVQAVRQRPRPVILANPDLVAPREDRLTLQPGYYCLLNWPGDLRSLIQVHGKPFQGVFDLVKARLKTLPRPPRPERTLMIGDTLHTDVLGGQAAGFHTALVTGYGAHKGLDIEHCIARSGIVPTYQLHAI